MARHYSIITIFVQYSASEGWRGWLALCNFENSIRGLGLARVGLITVPGGNSPGHYRESDLVTSVTGHHGSAAHHIYHSKFMIVFSF